MADDVSQSVTNWRMVVRTVTSSMRENADVVASVLERDFFPDDPQGRVEEMILARASALDRKLDTFEQRERALMLERRDDRGAGAELDASVLDLRTGVMRTRSAVESAYAATVVESIGLTGETPDNADALVVYATTAVEGLREPLPDPVDDLVQIDPVQLAARLEERVGGVQAAQQRVATEEREEQSAMAARDAAEADLRRAYIAAADGFAGDAAAGGRPDIADRVRPTSRRRQGLPEPVDLVPPVTTGTDPTLVDGDPTKQG